MQEPVKEIKVRKTAGLDGCAAESLRKTDSDKIAKCLFCE